MDYEIAGRRRTSAGTFSRVAVAAAVALVMMCGLGCQAHHGERETGAAVKPPTTRPTAGKPLGFSGMAQYGKAAFLVVHDTKNPSHEPRVSVLEVGTPETGPSVVPVDVDWGGQESSNDLEAACAVPGTADEFLLSESGYVNGKYGRLFHVQLSHRGAGYALAVKHVAMLPKLGDEIEGIVCVARRDGSRLLIFGERGGKAPSTNPAAPPVKPATLHWATWEPATTQIVAKPASRPLVAPPLSPPAGVGQRVCGDLFVDAQNGIWAVSTLDPGDAGPFRSVIYRAGIVNPEAAEPVELLAETRAAWALDGLKVEALGGPVVPRSALSVASDDEAYPGVWRPLFPAAAP